jgi:peptide/nickel transport system permease protein
VLNTISQFGIAIPIFWVGLIFIYSFALRLMILPAGGFPPNGWSDFGGSLKSLVLPVATISFVMSASLTRYVRSATLDVLNSEYLRTARALGFSQRQAIWNHGVRNAASPIISILGIELATTFVGAVVVETVFALPGLGSMLVRAIQESDYVSMQGVLFVSTLVVMMSGFFADALQKWVDPRLNRFSIKSETQ